MGLTISNLLRNFLGKEDVRILMVGLDAAGKTTILFQLKVGEVISTIPTIGFNVETVEYKNIRFTVWDVGGQERIRRLWHHYFVNTGAIIYVVDSADAERMGEAALELHGLLQRYELQDVVLLVLANKQDLPGALSITEVVDRLELRNVKHIWHAHATCATTGSGIYDGLEHLREMLDKRKSLKSNY